MSEKTLPASSKLRFKISAGNFVFALLLSLLSISFAYGYENSSISGDYWISKYEHRTTGTPYHYCSIGTFNFDGNGNYTYSIKYSKEGVGANQTESGSGTYNVTSDGKLSVDGYTVGRIQEGGNAVIGSDVGCTDQWEIGVLVKKDLMAMPWVYLLLLDD